MRQGGFDFDAVYGAGTSARQGGAPQNFAESNYFLDQYDAQLNRQKAIRDSIQDGKMAVELAKYDLIEEKPKPLDLSSGFSTIGSAFGFLKNPEIAETIGKWVGIERRN